MQDAMHTLGRTVPAGFTLTLANLMRDYAAFSDPNARNTRHYAYVSVVDPAVLRNLFLVADLPRNS